VRVPGPIDHVISPKRGSGTNPFVQVYQRAVPSIFQPAGYSAFLRRRKITPNKTTAATMQTIRTVEVSIPSSFTAFMAVIFLSARIAEA
jgi:hypothetical protein